VVPCCSPPADGVGANEKVGGGVKLIEDAEPIDDFSVLAGLPKEGELNVDVPNPVFGIEKANGEVFVVFSGGDAVVVVGILKLKPVDGVKSLLAVVVIGFVKLNNGKDDELVVVVVVVVAVGIGGGRRNENEGVVD
jgi:hypothetical protein